MIIALAAVDSFFGLQEYGAQFTVAMNAVTIIKKIDIHEIHIRVCTDIKIPFYLTNRPALKYRERGCDTKAALQRTTRAKFLKSSPESGFALFIILTFTICERKVKTWVQYLVCWNTSYLFPYWGFLSLRTKGAW